jgi:hypothetical protein
MSEPSSGPWWWEYASGDAVIITDKDGQYVCGLGADVIDVANANAITATPDYFAAVEVLLNHPNVSLGDLVYVVRERELKGWDGPNVIAWSEAVETLRRAHAKAKGES